MTIAGASFGATQGSGSVTFNGVAASITSWSATAIVAIVPSGATSGNVVVTVGGTASNGVGFTVAVSNPTFSPAPGTYSSGQMVTISTSTAGAMIYYTTDGSTPTTSSTHYLAPFSIGANTTINAIAAAGGYANSGVTSAVYTISAPPSITSITPTSGTAGALVTVSGTGFGSAQGTGVVWLGSSPGAVSSWSNTQITATVSQIAASGNVMVQQSGAVSNSVPFAITPSVTISGVSPASGPPGTQVTISGSGFGPAQGGSQVVLGTANALVQSWSATQIVATVATGSLSGLAQVLINGVWISGGPFAVSVPQITSVSPSIGPPGTVVTITGSGFGATQGAGTLTIGNTAGLVNSWSDTQVVAAVASSALSGLVSIQQNSYSSNAPSFIVTNGSGGTEMAKSSATNRPRPAESSGVSGMALAPYLLNLAVGDTPTIGALNLEGQPITGLAWTSSNPAVVSIASVDPTVLTAVAVGQATITAGTATASVTVSAGGGTLPTGTVLWSNPDDGSGVSSIVPAVPATTGVADVFSFQGDGTVAAITGTGITAWTADVSLAISPPLPDFLGGLVYAAFAPGQCCAVASIERLHGITGQVDASYTPAGVGGGAVNLWGSGQTLAVHTDGTIFALLSSYDPNSGNATNSLTGIDPGSGAQKFSVPLESGASPVSDLIVAGDGNAYVAYTTYDVTILAAGGESITGHLKLLQAGSAGASAVIPIQDFPLPFADNNSEVIYANLITNADTGVVVTWEWGLLPNPEFRLRAKPAERPRGVRRLS